MKLIPAIDIIEGKCVRLTKGDYNRKTIYNENPLEVAKQFEGAGIKHLHVVDLDGAKAKQIVNYHTLELLAKQTSLHIDFGGGIKNRSDIDIAFQSGANQITVGSVAAKHPDRFLSWLSAYGAEKIILGADAKDRKIATMGWKETSDLDVVSFIKNYEEQGVSQVICTDIDKDGMLQGPSFELYQEILDTTDVELIASGGISSLHDIEQLHDLGCHGAIIGKAIYEGKISLSELKPLC